MAEQGDRLRSVQQVLTMKASVFESSIAAVVIMSARCLLVVGYASAFEWPQGYMTIPFDQYLLLSIAVATFSVAFVLWRYWPQNMSGAKRGAIVGFFVGLISHPTTWFIYFLTSPQRGQPFQLDKVLAASMVYGVISLLIYGFFTVVATTLTGAIVGHVCSMDGTPDETGGDSVDNHAS